MMIKEDFEPLFPPGRHYISIEVLKQRCVLDFRSKEREQIFAAFQELWDLLRSFCIAAEIWVNGSFVTKKKDPSDIDLSIMVRHANLHGMSSDALDFLEELDRPDQKYRDIVDAFVVQLQDDGVEISDEDDTESWAKQWSVEHNGTWLKGFVVLNTVEGHAGLLVCTAARAGASICR